MNSIWENQFRDHKDRRSYLTYTFDFTNIEGYILEFGVWKGTTINHLATLTDKTIYGFDSFQGFPEDWRWKKDKTFIKGDLSLEEVPEVLDNVNLYIGLFEDSIPKWKENHKGPIQFLHIDSDLYSSCKTILTELNAQIFPGTIIVFDELFDYLDWENGEWKALNEWLEDFDREYIPISRFRYQAGIKVVK